MRRRLLVACAVLFGSAPVLCAADAPIKQFRETIAQGKKAAVWATMCKQTLCSENVCLTFRDDQHRPARATVFLEATWPSKSETSEQIGSYCTPTKWMTYFMTCIVYVEALDGNLVVSYRE